MRLSFDEAVERLHSMTVASFPPNASRAHMKFVFNTGIAVLAGVYGVQDTKSLEMH